MSAARDKRFQELVEASSHGIVVHLEDQILFANPAAAHTLGYDDADDLLALASVNDIIAPSERARLKGYRRSRMQRGDAPRYYETRFQRKDGTIIWVENGVALVDWDSRPAIQIGFIDISERKVAEEALRHVASGVSSETGTKFFRALARYLLEILNADFAFVGQLKEGDPNTIQTVAFCDHGRIGPNFEYPLPGSPCETVVGRNVCVYPRGVCQAFPEDRPLVEKGIECYIGTPLFSSRGDPLGLISVMYVEPQSETSLRANLVQIFADRAAAEIERLRVEAARMAAESQLRILNEELEERVVQRTAELESFTYSVSHDLRAPLRHVAGYVQLLEKSAHERLNDQDRRYLDTITQSSQRMGDLIDHLLEFSRIGRAEIQTSSVDLNALLDGVLEDLEPETIGRPIEWSREKLPTVEGDPRMLRLVLVNLIANAIKFTRGREPARITIATEPDRDGTAVVYIRDNGVGFDMRYVDKLFGVFERLHAASEFEGTGIGLANVRRIIHRHGGRTWAHSHAGGGATFHFSLPRKGEPGHDGDRAHIAGGG